MPLLTTEEVAKLLRVHPKHVYRLLKKGLPARRVGSEWRYEPAEVLAWSRTGADSEPAARLEAPAASIAGADVGPQPAAAAPPLVAANGDRVVTTLLRLLQEAGTLLGLVQADKETGLALLGAGEVIAAGVHAGGFPSRLGGERLARIHLVEREIGLVGRGEPPRLRDLATARLASRPPSAGVRRHLDEALAAEGLDPREIGARALACASHLEVACAVARADAEVGLASRAWAAELGLAFRPLAREAYGLLVRARDLGDPNVVRLCELAQGERFRRAVAGVAGYDPAGAGDIRYDGGPL
ncbi:MAG TPA: helix-turn-helix transcriptional regulator [Anaeromyxobacteraceae bacterium]|nr:helix-turn-helix transcriptional regulator [Anaeromyxobacteraceae bacterium]